MKTCPICGAGRMKKREMAYLEWHGKNLLVVDRMPVHICDICGERDYDSEAIESLQQLLWSNSPVITSRAISRHTWLGD